MTEGEITHRFFILLQTTHLVVSKEGPGFVQKSHGSEMEGVSGLHLQVCGGREVVVSQAHPLFRERVWYVAIQQFVLTAN
jgi:hypothetical protein